MSKTETQKQPMFDFTGNNLSLDFCNTLHDRKSTPLELLTGYDRLLVWSQDAHILTEEEAQLLTEEARFHQEEAAAVLRQAIDLREAIFHLCAAYIQHSPAEETDLITFNTALSMAHSCIVPGEHGFAWDWLPKEGALDRMLWPVVRTAADLLTSEELKDARICASDTCGWLFIDQSKNHTRRWCDMKSCGNRAKARKHYIEKKQSNKMSPLDDTA
jgi:predicted RNA-binding Zn ribbon-like protein